MKFIAALLELRLRLHEINQKLDRAQNAREMLISADSWFAGGGDFSAANTYNSSAPCAYSL